MVREDEVFKAILAMDSYNRGYEPKISGLGGVNSKIGNLEIIEESDTRENSPESDASFYAVAYKDTKGSSDVTDDEIIISYRGTDNPLDAVTGWITGGGIINDNFTFLQASKAAEFYQEVISKEIGETESPYLANASFTGHSLGGGLAGLMASLYGKEAIVFNNMPFELAVTNILDASIPDSLLEAFLAVYLPDYFSLSPLLSFDLGTKDTFYFNNSIPQAPNRDKIDAYATTGEVIDDFQLRTLQNTPVTFLDSNADS